MFDVKHSEGRPSVVPPWQFGSFSEEKRIGTADQHADTGCKPWSLAEDFLRIDGARSHEIPRARDVFGTLCYHIDIREIPCRFLKKYRFTLVRFQQSDVHLRAQDRDGDPRKTSARPNIENPARRREKRSKENALAIVPDNSFFRVADRG